MHPLWRGGREAPGPATLQVRQATCSSGAERHFAGRLCGVGTVLPLRGLRSGTSCCPSGAAEPFDFDFAWVTCQSAQSCAAYCNIE